MPCTKIVSQVVCGRSLVGNIGCVLPNKRASPKTVRPFFVEQSIDRMVAMWSGTNFSPYDLIIAYFKMKIYPKKLSLDERIVFLHLSIIYISKQRYKYSS